MHGHATPRKVADRVHSAAIHLLRLLRRQDAALGVGPARLSVLSVLVFGGSRTISQLAASEQVRLPTMSRLVAGMERDGLAHREPDPHDGRSVRVTATALGKRVLGRGRERRVEELAERLERRSSEEIALLGRAAELIEQLVVTR